MHHHIKCTVEEVDTMELQTQIWMPNQRAKLFGVTSKISNITKATSKLEETVKADDGWLLLEASESDILLEDLAVSL